MREVVTGAVTLLLPDSQDDRLDLVKRVSDGEVDIGMDSRGFGKLKAKKAKQRLDELAGKKTTLKTRPVTKRGKVRAGKRLIRAGKIAPSTNDAMNRMSRTLGDAFDRMRDKTIAFIRRDFKKLAKADAPDELLQAILDALGVNWDDIPDAIKADLAQAALAGVSEGLVQIELQDAGLIDDLNSTAQEWAEDRAAEMVGKKWVDGELVDNPNAEWVISDTTRDQLQQIIADSFEKPTTMEELVDQIQEAGTFSRARAEMIAKTEVIKAEVQANLNVWQESGLVQTVDWLISDDHDSDDECDDNADGGPYAIDEVPEFPAHPNCECVLAAADITSPEQDTTEEAA